MSHAIRLSRLAAIAACLFVITAAVSACGSSSSKSSTSSGVVGLEFDVGNLDGGDRHAQAGRVADRARARRVRRRVAGRPRSCDQRQWGRRPGSDELDLRTAVPARRRREGGPRSGRLRHPVGGRQDVDDHAAAEPQVLRRYAFERAGRGGELDARPRQPVHLQAGPSAGEVDHRAERDDGGVEPGRPRRRVPESAAGRQPELDRLAGRAQEHGGAGVQDQARRRRPVHGRQRHAQQHAGAEEEPELLADRASLPRQPDIQGHRRRRGRARGAAVGRRTGLRRDGDPVAGEYRTSRTSRRPSSRRPPRTTSS